MDSLGVELKNARMRKGLSLEEVSGITRIPIRRLIDIEGDDFSSMDSAFLYRSFARQFAQCVNLDRSTLDPALDAAVRNIPEPLVPGQNPARLRPDLPGLKPKKTHKLRWFLSVASLAVMLGACSTLYQFWESTRPLPEASKQKTAAPTQPAPNAAPQSESRLAVPAPGPADSLEIKLSALENTWLSLAADGREVFKGTLKADESKTLEGRQTAQVRTRNAGAVEIVFNGRPLGKIGAEGQVRTVVFTKDSYNVLHAQLSLPLASLIRGLE
jgi:cytoskeleton protein RodZ